MWAKLFIASLSVLCLGLYGPGEDGSASSYLVPLAHAAPNTADVPARDLNTSREDAALVETCLKAANGDPEGCMCVARVLKMDMSLRAYKAAAATYDEDNGGPAAEAVLNRQTYTDADIAGVRRDVRRLLSPQNIDAVCPAATEYFEAAKAKSAAKK